jgi:hypothetical protein
MGGVISLLLLYSFVACTGTTFKSVVNEFVIGRRCVRHVIVMDCWHVVLATNARSYRWCSVHYVKLKSNL